MQKLAEISIKRPVFASMLILALVVIGAAGHGKLGVDRYPSVDFPTVRISTSLPGASPAEMESLVSQRIEEVVNTVEGIQELRSISGPGNSFIIVTFDLNRNVDTAAQDVRDRVATVLRDLPREVNPPVVSKFDNDQIPIMNISLSGERSRRELSEIADKIVKVQLERSSGVGEVEVVGEIERSINVWIDADRLAAYQIPITAVREAIVRQNANIPGGNVTGAVREESLRTLGRLMDPRDFKDLVVETRNGVPIRLSDLGRIEDGTKEPRSFSRLNGIPNVSLDIRRQSGANTVAVIEGIKEKLEQLEGQLPPDVKMEVIRDQSRYIYEALHEINKHLILGSILASLVVLLFMRSWRATIIAAVAIPASVIATFGMMWALDFTLNSVTMLALVLMVGIVIDDAIVVLENIFRFVEEKKMSGFQAAQAATAEIGLAVMATTFSLVVIFVPVSFMSSISGRFLYQFGITSAVAVLISLLVSFTLTPMMSARLYGFRSREKESKHKNAESRGGFYSVIDRIYMASLRFSMRHRSWVAGLGVLVILASYPLYKMVQQEFTPRNTDNGEFEISISAREGTSLASMDQAVQAVEAEMKGLKGIQTIVASAGSGGFGSVNSARIFVVMTPHKDRTFSWSRLASLNPLNAFRGNFSQQDVIREVRRRMAKFTDLRVSVRSSQSSINVGGPNFDIDFSLLGPDLEALAEYADALRRKSGELGLVDADTTLRLDKPELRVEIDRARAAALSVDTDDIATALRIMVGGDDRVSRFRDPLMSEDYDVALRLDEGERNDAGAISRLYIPRQTGDLVRLDNVVSIVPGLTASRIDRLDRQRQVSLRAGIAPGYALADRLAALRAEVDRMNLPAAYSTRVSGSGRELEKTFREFLWAFLLSVIFMYLILASQFESLVHPFTILLSLPLSVPFALFSLWATDNTINLYSALGLLVLFGVVKKNAILQIDHMNNLRAAGMDKMSAIMEGNRDRLRPILMTTLALVAGMLPLALGTGPGAEERRAVAVVVIGGQTLSLLLTLLVTPVAYSLLDQIGERFHWKRLTARWQPEPEPAATEAST